MNPDTVVHRSKLTADPVSTARRFPLAALRVPVWQQLPCRFDIPPHPPPMEKSMPMSDATWTVFVTQIWLIGLVLWVLWRL